MGRVSVLPDALANQIAAGEVVERPASVVKELVENALDAEASRVFVAITGGGQALVRVLDDGVGMAREDAVLALQRHATSKITTAEDLHGIDTLGFRGEALPSIASVSRFRLITREHDAPSATEVTVEGGAAAVVKDAGAPPGTRIEVVDLFYNVPARLKFLKAEATENRHVAALMTAFALGHPHIHFRLDKDGRTIADYPVARRLDQRIFQVLGKSVAERLHEVVGEGPVQVRGYISEPGFTRTNQNNIHTFVNGRRVRDRTVTHALVAGYGELLQRGHFPQGVLYVHLDPQLIDVNVHPAKAEIRFVDGGAVHEAIVRAVRATLHDAPWRRRGGAG
ncbi:MAG: DNA mismatch repair endonuclease MutL, partial [Deltaproteobacteria bacterium]